MHVGGQPVRVDGSARRGQALRDELAAERTLALRTAGRPDPRIGIGTSLQLEQRQQPAHRGAASRTRCHGAVIRRAGRSRSR